MEDHAIIKNFFEDMSKEEIVDHIVEIEEIISTMRGRCTYEKEKSRNAYMAYRSVNYLQNILIQTILKADQLIRPSSSAI
jgi:hypothetical protein